MGFLSNKFGHKKSEMKKGEILPASVMKEKYDFTIENHKSQHLDPKNVPEQFRDLVELAQKWGIGDDIIRNDLHEKATLEEKQILKSALNGRTRAINEWLDTFGAAEMTEAAGAFMYMLLGLDEMGIQIKP